MYIRPTNQPSRAQIKVYGPSFQPATSEKSISNGVEVKVHCLKGPEPQRNRLGARTFSVPYEPLLPTGSYRWKSYSAHLLYSPAPLFPRSLVWSELSEGDLSAPSPRVCEWSLVQRVDLYSQKSGLKQRWPRAPAFTAYTGSMLRDAFAEGPLSFSLCFSLHYTVFAFDLNSNWWERSNRQRAVRFYIRYDRICTNA